MKRMNYWLKIIIGVCVITLFALQGCTTTTDRAFKGDLNTIRSLKVVRYETPKITVAPSFAGMMFGAVVGGAIGGATAGILGGGSGAMSIGNTVADGVQSRLTETLNKESPIPDFGRLVVEKFTKRAKNEIPNWSPISISIMDEPVSGNFKTQSILLNFEVRGIQYRSVVAVGTTVSMKDPAGGILWQRTFSYNSNNFNRCKSKDEFEADNYKLLKEELEFAAEQTALDFIKHFKAGKGQNDKDK